MKQALLQLAQEVFIAAKVLLFAAGELSAALLLLLELLRGRGGSRQLVLGFLFPGCGGTRVKDSD